MNMCRVIPSLSLILVAFGLGTGPAAADDQEKALALGDSVVFGYITQAGHEYVNARNFVGSPEHLAALLHLEAVNAACPGEASGSFLSSSAPDHGCRAYRSAFPLHVPYGSTQLAFATSFLTQHRGTRLVTLGLGANDVLILQDACATDPNPPQCIGAGLPAVLAGVASNVATIVATLRATGFAGVIVIVNYYSPDYSDPSQTAITMAVNQVIGAAAQAYGAAVADVFTAFQKVASNPAFAGKTCNAGLLNVDPQNQALCDVHPSQSGQRLIAETVARTYFTVSR